MASSRRRGRRNQRRFGDLKVPGRDLDGTRRSFSSIGCIRLGLAHVVSREGQDLHVDFHGSLRDLSPSPRTFRHGSKPINELPDENPDSRACPPTSGRLQQTALSWVKPPHPLDSVLTDGFCRGPGRPAGPSRLLRSRRHRRPPAVTDSSGSGAAPSTAPWAPSPGSSLPPRPADQSFPPPAGRPGPLRYRPTSQLRTYRSPG